MEMLYTDMTERKTPVMAQRENDNGFKTALKAVMAVLSAGFIAVPIAATGVFVPEMLPFFLTAIPGLFGIVAVLLVGLSRVY